MIVLCSGVAWAAPVEVNSIADLQSNVTGASGNTVIILGDSFGTIDQTITLNVPSGADVTIQGRTGSGLLIINQTATTKHFNVIGSGNITFKNIEFVGNIKETDLNSDGSFKDGVFSSLKSGGGVNLGSYTGEIIFENCSFKQIAGGAFNGKAGKITFEKTSFLSNANTWGAAIIIDNNQNPLHINNCTFANNYGTGWSGYFGGTISMKSGSVFVMNNSAFYNNIFLGQGGFSGGGGAIGLSMWDGNSIVQISDCVFENNTVTSTTGSGTADGGALYMIQVYGKINVSGSTFINNSAFDEGGAISFINCNNSDNKVINSTFYGNKAEGKDNNDGNEDGGGGAIEIYSSYANTYVTFEGNTFTKNTAEKGKNPDGNFGGAISSARDGTGNPGSTATVVLINNIISGNNDSYQNSADYANVRKIGGLTADEKRYNVIDKDIEDVFGTNDPKLIAIGSKKAGDPKNEGNEKLYMTIKTIPIKPEGDAEGKTSVGVPSTLTSDQNGNLRSSENPDFGAVEMKYIRYDADGGTWTNIFSSDVVNDTDEFYIVGSAYYYQTLPEGSSVAVTSNKPAKTGFTFVKWLVDGTDQTPGAVVSGDYYLKAQWAADGAVFTVVFQDWDNTMLKTETVVPGAGATAPADPARDGYTFDGWNKDFSAVTEDLTVTALYKKNGSSSGGNSTGSGKVSESSNSSEIKPSEPMPGYEETPVTAPAAPAAIIVLFYMLAVACYAFVIKTDEE